MGLIQVNSGVILISFVKGLQKKVPEKVTTQSLKPYKPDELEIFNYLQKGSRSIPKLLLCAEVS